MHEILAQVYRSTRTDYMKAMDKWDMIVREQSSAAILEAMDIDDQPQRQWMQAEERFWLWQYGLARLQTVVHLSPDTLPEDIPKAFRKGIRRPKPDFSKYDGNIQSEVLKLTDGQSLEQRFAATQDLFDFDLERFRSLMSNPGA